MSKKYITFAAANKNNDIMKKILFAAMVCCVAMTSIMLASCENQNTPTEVKELEALDPYLVWGADYADVLQHIEAKKWWENGNDSLEYWESINCWHRWFWVDSTLTEQYLFETQDGKNLLGVQCYCYSNTIPSTTAQTYLENQGYIFFSKRHSDRGEVYIYMSADKLTRAIIYPNLNDTWYIEYAPMPNLD